MDLEQRLLDSHKTLSRINATVVALILVMSVYVLQRALAVIVGSPELLSSLTSNEGFQIRFFQLGFSYNTMTVLWPGVLGGLCVLYATLENKRNRIEHSVRRLGGAMRDADMLELDPLHVSPSLFGSATSRWVARGLAIFPAVAVTAHVAMILMWAFSLGWSATRRLWPSESALGGVSVAAGSVFSLSSLLFTVVGFFGALLFWKVSRAKISRAGLHA